MAPMALVDMVHIVGSPGDDRAYCGITGMPKTETAKSVGERLQRVFGPEKIRGGPRPVVYCTPCWMKWAEES